MSQTNGIVTRKLGKSFPGVRALDDFDFDIRPGEVHCLLGENGAGKSTFINILSGSFSEYEGEIEIDSAPVTITSPARAKALRIATIHQEQCLVPAMTVEENIHLGTEPRRGRFMVDHPKACESARAVLGRLGVAIDPGARVRSLSTAEAQMVEIAKALVLDARILILDEPTASISEREAQELFRIIRELKARGTGFVYISHRLQEIAEIADRVTVMRDGKKVGELAASDASTERIVELMVGRSIGDMLASPRSVATSDIALSVNDLSGSGVKDASFALKRGEILGFAGLVGAGRTELMKMIFGALPRQSGEILLDGKPAHISSPRDAVQFGIGYLSEDRKGEGLVLKQPIDWNISLASLPKLSSGPVVDRRRERAVAKIYRERLSIATPSLDKQAGQLSGGNQQKVVVAKWLETGCRILIFDEPTRGIDVYARTEIHALIRDLAEKGTSIIVVSSDLPELIQVSDRILAMSEGRITGEVAVARTARQAEVMELMLGGAHV
ncbi:MAG: sugar ABC transporter ATP-binding protein [Alphaproteobacteria bacterium]|nr:sugar ABC transporter ATP-binding protein [Alphaproteobacteria bacterium]